MKVVRVWGGGIPGRASWEGSSVATCMFSLDTFGIGIGESGRKEERTA